jgi:hypothetical protein
VKREEEEGGGGGLLTGIVVNYKFVKTKKKANKVESKDQIDHLESQSIFTNLYASISHSR